MSFKLVFQGRCHVSSVNRIPHKPAQGSEVELFTLFNALWRMRYSIVGIAFVCAVIAAIYAFSATREYRVTSVLRPIQSNDLDRLNRSQIFSLSPEMALKRVENALNSYGNRLAFYKANPSLFKNDEDESRTVEQNFEEFNRVGVRVTDDSATPGKPLSLTLEFNYPEYFDGVELLNQFVDFTLKAERERLAVEYTAILNNRIAEIDRHINNSKTTYALEKEAKIARLEETDDIRRAQLQDELSALRQQLKVIRKDRIAELGEAIAVAKTLGIKKPTTPSAMGEPDNRGLSGVRTEINSQKIPLYFMGTDALEAERAVLSQGSSDEFTDIRVSQILKELQMLQVNREVQALQARGKEELYLEDVQAQRKEFLRLSALGVSVNDMLLVDVDRKAVEPIEAIKPKKALIIILGIIVGLMLGVAIAIVRELERVRKVSAQSVSFGHQTLSEPSKTALLD